MKMKTKIPMMLKEVWKMKEKVYYKIKDMEDDELFKFVENTTKEITDEVEHPNPASNNA